MITLKGESTKVPGLNEKLITINPGDIWPLPFKGSRYSLKRKDKKIRMCWTRRDVIHCAETLPQGLLKAMKRHRGEHRGRIRITPHKEVITKKYIDNGLWQPIYLGILDGTPIFPGFNLDPIKIQRGNLWPGLHFKHGEQFAIWNRDGNDDYVYWTSKGIYFRSITKYPELCLAVREIRPRCGRVYFTEFGHIWMNLPGSEISYEWAARFKNLLKKDKKLLQKSNDDTLLQSIFERIRATGAYPIYLGHISDFDSGESPRTHFTSETEFGYGGEDIDDSDELEGRYRCKKNEYSSKSWKKMGRDL